MTLLLTEDEVDGLLDMASTLPVVESVFRAHGDGEATNHARRRVALPTGGLHVMFAGAPQIDAMGLKAYSVSSSGARFYTMLFHPHSGELLAILQSDRLGQLRTGASTGVATKYLAREDASTLGMYGAGWQAESQLEAVAAVKGLSRVVVHSRTQESQERFAQKMGERIGLAIETTGTPEEPAAQDMVVTATSSKEPVLKGEWLSPGTHVTATGSNSLLKSEVDREVVHRADFVCVDSKEELGLEAGDLMLPLEAGGLLPEAVFELGSVVAGYVKGRQKESDITFFASQGLALQDMAAARLVYDRARERGVGREVDF